MKLICSALLVLVSINAFAVQAPSQSCRMGVLTKAVQIKSDAKDVIREIEDEMDASLDRTGDPTLGMGTRQMSQAATSILDSVRDLQENLGRRVSSESAEWIVKLCKNKLDVHTVLEND
jgi:hypothetical protein